MNRVINFFESLNIRAEGWFISKPYRLGQFYAFITTLCNFIIQLIVSLLSGLLISIEHFRKLFFSFDGRSGLVLLSTFEHR